MCHHRWRFTGLLSQAWERKIHHRWSRHAYRTHQQHDVPHNHAWHLRHHHHNLTSVLRASRLVNSWLFRWSLQKRDWWRELVHCSPQIHNSGCWKTDWSQGCFVFHLSICHDHKKTNTLAKQYRTNSSTSFLQSFTGISTHNSTHTYIVYKKI